MLNAHQNNRDTYDTPCVSWLTLRPVPAKDGRIDQYTVDLFLGDYAVLSRVADGWSVSVHRRDQSASDRGLFATPMDALAVLEAEVIHRCTESRARAAAPRYASR